MVIATLQIKDVFGLVVGPLPDSYVEKVAALWGARASVHPIEIVVAGTTMQWNSSAKARRTLMI